MKAGLRGAGAAPKAEGKVGGFRELDHGTFEYFGWVGWARMKDRGPSRCAGPKTKRGGGGAREGALPGPEERRWRTSRAAAKDEGRKRANWEWGEAPCGVLREPCGVL